MLRRLLAEDLGGGKGAHFTQTGGAEGPQVFKSQWKMENPWGWSIAGYGIQQWDNLEGQYGRMKPDFNDKGGNDA